MKENMTVKDLKEFLNEFPDDAKVCTDTNNHYSTDGIEYATLIQTENKKILFIGNTIHDGEYIMYYDLRDLKFLIKRNIWE